MQHQGRIKLCAALELLACCVLASLPGCQLIGGAIENYRKDSTHKITALYTGLGGHSFAVVVSADRSIQGDHPGLVDHLTRRITERLAAPGNTPTASGVITAEQVLRYQSRHPDWHAKPYDVLAKELGGVDRLVLVEVSEYRLSEPGNEYEWDGIATGSVRVVEASDGSSDVFAFDKLVSVKFPNKKGITPEQVGLPAVTSALALRFIDRVSWCFYDHQEPYYPEY